MIEVSVKNDGITVAGHAAYAPLGQDIICAGASALTQTLIKSIEDLTQDKIKYSVSPGRVDIECKNLSEKSRTLVDSFFIGICQIADEYPDYIRIV
ncbi:MAG: ribosomal-processing cysteine protease Prp [Hespellia sp.]|nr:ribosomal-processing cysteine protease Prp [Hespellia sp.]